MVPSLAIVAVAALGLVGCHGSAAPAPVQSNGAGVAESPAAPRGPARSGDDSSVEDAASSDEQRAQDELAKKNDGRPVLVCFGDSLTAGLGTGAGQSYPDYLQKDLDALGYQYRVVNEGISGNTTKDGVMRLPEILRLHPQIAVVEFGGNDGLRGLPIETTQANLDEIVGRLKAAGVKVVLAGITLPPDYGEDYIGRFDAMYTATAKKNGVSMLPFLLEHVYGVPGMMQRDQTHATAKGNEVVARNVLGLVRPLLRKK
ncbi:MAG TPA: arylesterase [Acidobacteriaceae bacterium]|nr:arylesterase [Acidobacteriaceae bacterium]